MFKLFKPKPKRLLGIDLHPSSIKLVEISKLAANYQLTAYNSVNIDSAYFENRSLKSRAELAATLKGIIQEVGISTKKVAIAVPDTLTLRKIIQLSASLSEREIQAFVMMEVEQLFSCSLNFLTYDYILLQSADLQASLVDVLIVALLKEEVDCRVALILEAGLRPIRVSLESYALKRAIDLLNPNNKDVTTGVLALQNEWLRLMVYKNAEVIFSHEQSVQEADFNLVNEAAFKSLDLFLSAMPLATLNPLWLVGEKKAVAALAACITMRVGIQSQIADPLTRVAIASCLDLETLKQEAPSYILPLGLGLMQ